MEDNQQANGSVWQEIRLPTIIGIGMLAGTLVMRAWRGGKRKAHLLLDAGALSSIILSLVGYRVSIS